MKSHSEASSQRNPHTTWIQIQPTTGGKTSAASASDQAVNNNNNNDTSNNNNNNEVVSLGGVYVSCLT